MKKFSIFSALMTSLFFIGTSFAMQPAISLNEQLLEVASNDINQIYELIGKGADVNYVHQPSGRTPLYLASYFAELENVKLLLLEGSNPNAGVGALLGLLRGIDEGAIENYKFAAATAALLISAHANYNAPEIQDFIKARPKLSTILNRAIELSQKFRRDQKLF